MIFIVILLGFVAVLGKIIYIQAVESGGETSADEQAYSGDSREYTRLQRSFVGKQYAAILYVYGYTRARVAR